MYTIIAGGTGLVGRELAGSLAADNHEVIILSRNPDKAVGLPNGVRAEHWDAKTAAGWGHLADGAGAIVNLAGENLAGSTFFPQRWTPERKRLFNDSRSNAGRAIVAAIDAASNKPKVLIQSSASGYYGIESSGKLTEDSPPGNDFQSKVCVAWEDSTKAVEDMGVRRVIIRTGVILSTQGGAFTRLVFPFKVMQLGGQLGSGRQWFPWIHHEDEVRAIRWLIENERASGPYNLSAPGIMTNADFTRVVGKVMKRPAFFPVPGFGIKLAFGEVATLVLDGWQAVSEKLQTAGFEFKYPHAESAVRELLGK